MEDEEGYTVLNLRPKRGASAGPTPTRIQGPPQDPCWHQRGQWAAYLAIVILMVTVTALGIWVFQLASEKQGIGGRDTSTANCNTRLEHFRSNLTQHLCHPAQPGPPGDSRCKLCPMDWQLLGDKCYWVSRESATWNKSVTACSARGSWLLMIRDHKELESLKDLTQGTSQFWVGLSHSLEKGWTWLDGSQLDQTLFPESGQTEEISCPIVRRNQIHSVTCGSAYKWICQRDAVLL